MVSVTLRTKPSINCIKKKIDYFIFKCQITRKYHNNHLNCLLEKNFLPNWGGPWILLKVSEQEIE